MPTMTRMTLKTVSIPNTSGLAMNREYAQIPRLHTRALGTTLIELVIAVSIMTVVIGTLLPLLSSARKTWDTSQNNAETLQNGRILMDHMNRWLSQAKSITSVSDSDTNLGTITFTDNQDTVYRYHVNGTNQVQFGEVGSLSTLAGPVAKFKFTCYDSNDLTSPITDVNDIRFIKIESEFINSGELTQNQSFSTSVFINVDPIQAVSDMVGWWCLDDATGTTATDSSGLGNHGTLINMSNDAWTQGIFSGALEFDGTDDYVDLPIGSVIQNLTNCTISGWVNWSGSGDTWQRIFDFGTNTDYNMFLTPNTNEGKVKFAMTQNSWMDEDQTISSESLSSEWHFWAVTIDDTNGIHTLYLDGEQAAQNTSARYNPSDLGQTTNHWLGRSQYSTDPYFDGILDDIRIYNYTMSAEQIADMNPALISFEDFTEAKADTDSTWLTISTPGGDGSIGTVGLLGGNSGLSCDPYSGSNRLLLFSAHAEDNTEDLSLNAVTYGGQPMTKITEESIQESNMRAYVVTYMLDEAGIANASSSTFATSWTGTPDEVQYVSGFLENVNQANPIGDFDGNSHKSKTTVSTNPLSTQDGDMAFVMATAGTGTNEHAQDLYQLNNGFTEAFDHSLASSEAVAGYRSCDGSNVTPSVYHSNPNRQVVIGFVVHAASATVSTINGDLLIAAVATDGDETISAPSNQDWTLLSLETSSGSAVTLGVWAKLAGSTEAGTQTFSWTSPEQAYGWIMRFKGHDPSNPLNAMNITGGGSTTTPISPSVATTVNNTMILRIGGFDEDDITVDNAGINNHTTITMDYSNVNVNGVSGGAAYMFHSTAGTSSSYNFTLTSGEEYRTVTIAIAPDSSTQ